MQKIITRKSIISKNIDRKTGKEAWSKNLQVAIFAADKIRSSLGPKGAYKMVAYNRGPEQVVKVTKDAIAVLDELAIQHPPAVIIAESAKMQRAEAGDGVATFVILLSALLKNADELTVNKIHPNTIIHGYFLAQNKALEIIDQQATVLNMADYDILDVVDCKRELLTPEMRLMIAEAYAVACWEGRYEKENVRFIKKPGADVKESSLIKGVVIKKEKAHPNMPDKVKNLRIAITTEKPGINRLELKMKGEGPVPLKLKIQSPSQIGEFKETENRLKTESLDMLTELGVNVLLCEQQLEISLKDKLRSMGVFALEKVDKKDTLAVAKATGAKPVWQLKELSEGDIGKAEELYTGRIELEKTVTIQGCRGATFLLRGSTSQGIDELEAAIRNAMTVTKLMTGDPRVLPGGGATETHIAQELKSYSKTFASKEQVVIDSFSNALMEVPRCLAENYGLNPTDTILELKNRHAEGMQNCGVSKHGCADAVCLEPVKITRSVIRRAYEVSSLMLHIDELLISKGIAKFHKK